jgi:hypothetical protein
MSTPDLAQIGAEMEDLGLLIGLLTGTKDNLEIDKEWFSDPERGLKAGFNWPNLLPVIKSHLGEVNHPAKGMDHDFKEKWFPVKLGDGKGGTKLSGFHVVQKEVGSLALIGVGLHKTFEYKDKKVIIDPFVFVPLIEMPNSAGTAATVGPAKKGPVEVGFKLTYGSTFSTFLPYDTILFAVSFEFGEEKVKPTIIFELLNSSTGAKNTDTDKNVALNTVLRLPEMKAFLEKPILKDNDHVTVTWAQLLLTLGWIKEGPKQYLVNEVKMPDVADALLEYVKKVLKDAFNEFMGSSQVVNLIEHKGKKATDPAWKVGLILEGGRYGINVQATNIVVSQSPLVKLQIGALTSVKVDWMRVSGGGFMPETKGINFFVLQNQAAAGDPPDIKFKPRLELISVGLDISKKNGQPLFDIKGYSLKQAQLRGYFSSIKKNKWGVGAAFNEISLPLGPPSKGSGVAQTLLASGEKKPEKEGEKKPAVNPAFSVLVAYQKKFFLKLFSTNGTPKNLVIIPIQKSFGPVSLKNIGLGWKNAPPDEREKVGYLMFGLTGGLDLDALKLKLDRLTVGVPIKTPDKPETFKLGLEGFDLTFNSGAVSMAGGFIKDSSGADPAYNGAVAIQAASWGITAMGSFSTVNNSPSLFIFGVLNAALGGPPVFFVTALAAGFGYNRKIVMPAINQVQNFPFVKAAINPDLFSGDKTNDVLASMSEAIPPELGQYWFAAGVKFNSFQLLNSFALLILQFGKKFEVDILGLSTLQLPKLDPDAKVKPYVNAQMAIKATFEPEEGLLAVEAQLADSSYVIHPSCKITGGFAYYSWFNGPHSGDFVVSLGGYNKNFDKAAYPHYPTVPRLAFNWKVSSSINFNGEAYFALTPSCVMAGGKLSLTYQEGDLQAWFKAVADFLIAWKPFHYDIGISINIGVSYRVNIAFIHKTITLELGVDVQMWGPEFGGVAEISLYIISFTVGFGADKNTEQKTISWKDFASYFLAGGDAKTQLQNLADAPKTDNIITINANAGIKQRIKKGTGEIWVVDAGTFDFNAVSTFPVSLITFKTEEGRVDAPEKKGKAFGIRPVGNVTLDGDASRFNLTLRKEDGAVFKPYSLEGWKLRANTDNVPEAMYGAVKDPKEKPAAKLVGGVTKGLASALPPLHPETGPDKFGSINLAYSLLPKKEYGLDATARATEITLGTEGSLDVIKTSLESATVKDARKDIIDALGQVLSLASANDDMHAMASAPRNIFQGSPMLATAAAQAQAVKATDRIVTGTRSTLRRNAVLTGGHQLKATIIKYSFDKSVQSGLIMRAGLYNTAASKGRYGQANPINTFDITAGILQVWQLDNAAGAETLRHSGSVAARMILFDEYLRVITDKVLSTAGVATEAIPTKATQMCLQGLGTSNTALAGWHEQSCLALVNPKYLVGKRCLIRPKNSHSVGKKQYIHDTGLVEGRSLVLGNMGAEKEGWIETRFYPGVKQVFVLARPDADATSAAPAFDTVVKLIYTNDAGTKTAQVLSADAVGANGAEAWAAFTLPDTVAGKHFSIWAETESEAGLQLAGTAGVEQALSAWTAGLSKQLATQDAGLDESNAKNKLTVSLKKVLNY